MKAIVYRQYGEPSEVLSYEEISAPATPGPNEATVRVVKRMIHPIDGMMVRGIIPMPIAPGGSVPGSDGVGIVEQVGADVDPSTGLAPGKRVIIFHAHGTWAEHMTAPAQSLIPFPDDVSDTAACQLSINGITAIMLMRAAIAADSRAGVHSPILVTAAGSSVGRNLIALAQMRGLKVVALVRSDSGAQILKNGTKDVPVVSTQHDNWAEAVTQAFGQAPSVAMDPISGEMTSKLLSLLADGGTLLIYGSLDSRPPAIQTTPIIIHQYGLRGVAAPAWLTSTSAEQRASDVADLFEMTRRASGNFTDYREFALTQAIDALSAAQATPRRGATILTSGG